VRRRPARLEDPNDLKRKLREAIDFQKPTTIPKKSITRRRRPSIGAPCRDRIGIAPDPSRHRLVSPKLRGAGPLRPGAARTVPVNTGVWPGLDTEGRASLIYCSRD
jgi:hypothetical protein